MAFNMMAYLKANMTTSRTNVKLELSAKRSTISFLISYWETLVCFCEQKFDFQNFTFFTEVSFI